MYEAIIFDLDGTLLDTLEDLYLSVNAALLACGLPARKKEEVRAFVGNGIVKLMKRATGEVSPEVEGRALAAFKAHYAVHCEDNTKPYDGVMELLAACKERGIKTAVVSNKADFAVQKLVKSFFGDLICTAVGENEEEGVRKKPAPDSLLAVMEKLRVSAEKVVYVGDAEVDIQTAENAGVDCISVSWGFKDREFLVRSGARRIVDTPREVLS